MKKFLLTLSAAASVAASAQTVAPGPVSVWESYGPMFTADRTLFYDTDAQGKNLPILWGFDTAWNDRGNMLRGLRHSGRETVGVARVSFQPWDVITEKGKLPASLQRNLEARLANVALAGKKVDIALNLDGGSPTIKEVYGYLDENDNYIGDKEAVADAYARLIDATAAAVEEAGYTVVSAAPFNEPDYFWNGTPIDVFGLINQRLKNFDEYPRFRNIRLSGGNTLNCDEALPWYEGLKENLDEGNTHQLAGDFDHYAAFFTKVREDGKYATADELHNVMEAMVGVEYGMQTGIWWGSAEQARGEFMKGSSGERLAYAENRQAWSAASVYRAPSGKIQGFAGCSERQALPSTFNFVSLNGPVFVDGVGPVQEYLLNLPGDPNGAYQTELQRNAETMITIENGEDVRPDIKGSYTIVNGANRTLVIGGKGGSTDNGTDITAQTATGAPHQQWTISRVPEDIGGDFSYYFIRNTTSGQSLDDNNWNIEEGGKVIAYAPSNNAVQQWALEYDGDGWFHIRNKQSALYLDATGATDGVTVVQNERSDLPSQLWRFIPEGAPLVFETPSAPTGLVAQAQSASILLSWDGTEGMTYTILRADSDDRFITIARGLESPSLLDNTVYPSETYTYKVMAEDRSGNRSLCSSPMEASPESAEALIARYPLSEDVNDHSGNGFTIKPFQNPSFRSGRTESSKALNLRGQQYMQLPYNLLDTKQFSIALWLYVTSPAEGMHVLTTGADSDHSLSLVTNQGGNMQLVCRNDGNEQTLTAPAIPQRQWTHLAITADGTNVTLFVDGKEAASADMAGAMPDNRLLTYLGRPHQAKQTYLVGYMQDVNIYNHPLTPESVIKDMEADYAGVESVAADKSATVIATEYYTLQGVRVASPVADGVTIIRTIYSDGSSTVAKQLR